DVADGETPRDITIGLVPFADTVNVGNTAYTRSWLSQDPLHTSFKHLGHDPEYVQTYFLKHNWLGCIAEPLPAEWGDATSLPAKAWTPSDEVFMPLHLRYSFTLDKNILGLDERERIRSSWNSTTYKITKFNILEN